MYDLPQRIQPHRAIHHLAKQAVPLPDAQGHKIRPGVGVIIILQADRAALVFARVEFHTNLPSNARFKIACRSLPVRFKLALGLLQLLNH